jgi:DNA-binding PadR family transcriptional regulator
MPRDVRHKRSKKTKKGMPASLHDYARRAMISKTMVAASTKPVILSILARGEMYGYQIIQHVTELSGGTLEWSEGMLYPVLHRMEKDELIQSQWRVSDNGRKRKYYHLTLQGREELEKDRNEWIKVNKLLNRLWSPLSLPD